MEAEIRQGFARQLRHWRSQRRLSQLSLALDAEVSQRHLSYLESGKAHPSRDMVLRLAQVLDLPLRERNLFLSVAGFAPVYSFQQLDEADMAPVRRALELMLSQQEPYPALVLDRRWRMRMANTGLQSLLAQFGQAEQLLALAQDEGLPNVMKLTFHPQGLRPHIENFDVIGAELINRCHREAAHDPAMQGLLDEILAYPDTPARWQEPDYSHSNAPLLSMRLRLGAERLSLFSTIATFGTPLDVTTDELRVESMFPADDASAAYLQRLAGSEPRLQ